MQLKFRAIVIDDMGFCRDLLTDFLEDRGYQVISFPDVTTCPLFPAGSSECPKQNACADFYLTDNRMPHMEGLDFLELQAQKKCRIDTAGKTIFSAHWTQEELNRANKLKCKTFHKPYDFAALETWLNEQEKTIPKDRILTEFDDVMVRNN